METTQQQENTDQATTPAVHVDTKYLPREYGERACWSWISHEDPQRSDSGLFDRPGFGRNRNGSLVMAVSESLRWAAEIGYQGVIVLTDNASVADQVNGVESAPEGANDEYREALQQAKDAMQAVGGLVAVIPPERNLARKACREGMAEIMVKYVMDEVADLSEPEDSTDAAEAQPVSLPRA